MNLIPLSLTPEWSCQVIGSLQESDDVSELSQDMLEVHLPGGLSIEVGWVPENDPNGAYQILLCLGMKVKREITRKTAVEARLVVEELASTGEWVSL